MREWWGGAVMWRVHWVRDWLRWFSPRRHRYEPRHMAAGYGYGPREYICGSMNLDDEREFLTTVPGTRMTIWAPSGEVEFSEEPGWPAEVAHEEPTEAEVAASRAAHGYIPELDLDGEARPDFKVGSLPVQLDSGPGDSALVAPGPDPEPKLGPNAARVLERWERRRRERWRLDWDNEAVAA